MRTEHQATISFTIYGEYTNKELTDIAAAILIDLEKLDLKNEISTSDLEIEITGMSHKEQEAYNNQ